MPTGIFRVAVCQLECHPALTIGDFDYLGEPFVPEPDDPSLAALSRFSLDVAALQANCSERYREWHANRLERVLDWLGGLAPVPQLIVLPEAAVPIDLLPPLRDFAVTHGVALFAGTHSLQLTHQNARRYKALRIVGKTLKSWGDDPGGCSAVLPVFSSNRTYFRRKSVSSVFEITDVRQDEDDVAVIDALPLQFDRQTIRVAPLVCAEALRLHQMPSGYDIAVVCSYNASVEPFAPFISQQVSNRIPVVLANDGRYGGSGVHVPIDRRMQTWWWNDPHGGRLPKGDGILVVDIDWDHIAPQVGVADPKPAAQLAACCAMTYQGASDEGFLTSSLLRDTQKHSDNSVQRELLSQALEKDLPAIQKAKVVQLHRLAEKGTADAGWWKCLGNDCPIPVQPDVRGLEEVLAAQGVRELYQILQTGSVDNAAELGKIAMLAQKCRLRAGDKAQQAPSVDRISRIIDREDRCRSIRGWLDSQRATLCFVFGLSAVGKSAVIDTAIQQSGHRHVLRVSLAPDSTTEFLVMSLLRHVGYDGAVGDGGAGEILATEFRDRLPRSAVIVIEKGHFLTADFIWRDPQCPSTLSTLAEVAGSREGTVIIESDYSLDVSTADPTHTQRTWVRGLSRDDATVLLDQQLRRVGLNPAHYSKEDRAAIVEGLDGHPGAIILASEYVEKTSIEQVVKDISSRKGMHRRIVSRILRLLHLSDEQGLVLSLLSLARAPIPSRVLSGVTEFNPMPALRDLWRLALVERHHSDYVAITGLLRGFADLPQPAQVEAARFHRRAAKTFARLAGAAETADQLRWAVEARYHAYSANAPELAPAVGELADGAIGVVRDLLDRQEYERARPVVDQLLKAHRKPEILELGARVYACLGKCDEALTLAKEAVSKQSQRVWILTEVGRRALHVHRDEIVEDAVRIAKATGVDNSFIAVLEGRMNLQRQQVDAAIAAFRRGVEISDRDGWPHFYLGRTLLKQGRIPEAVEILEQGESVEISRHRLRRNALAALRTQLAYAYLLQDDISTAKQWLDIIAEDNGVSPEVARAYMYIDLLTGRARLTDEALSGLDPTTAKNRHERAQIHLFRGLFYLNIGHRERASEELSQASQADPRNVFVLLRWARVLLEIARDAAVEQEHEAARVCAEHAQSVANKVLEFDRDNADALAILETLSDEFNVL